MSEVPEVYERRSRREVTAELREGTRTIRRWVKGKSVDGRRLCEELDAWLDYFGGWSQPVPPWPGAVLSGLTDEDGKPTWLAQAGQVPGELVRPGTGWGWEIQDDWPEDRWVEVRGPLLELAPESDSARDPEPVRVDVMVAVRDSLPIFADAATDGLAVEADRVHRTAVGDLVCSGLDDEGRRWHQVVAADDTVAVCGLTAGYGDQ